MAVEIPISVVVQDFDLQVELDGSTYTLGFQWNERDAAWYLSVATAEEEPIVTGRKVVIDLPLLARFTDPRLPPGVLIAIDTGPNRQDPGFAELGRRVQLLYFGEEELPVT